MDVVTLLIGASGNQAGGTYDAGTPQTSCSLTVTVSGSPSFSVQLQGSADAATWANVGAALTTATTASGLTPSPSARYFRAVLKSYTGPGAVTVTLGFTAGTGYTSGPPVLTANVTATTSGPLALDTVTEASASGGNLTMTLPASVAGQMIVCEKSDSSANTVAITGSIRGVSSSTLTLKLPNESIMLLGSAGSWWPVAGHKTLGSLDGRYGQVFSPMAFGATGDGTTDDHAAVQAAFNAAAAVKGVVDLGTTKYRTASVITLPTGSFTLRGNPQMDAGGNGGSLVNITGDMFSIPAAMSGAVFDGVTLVCGGGSGGHIINCAANAAISNTIWRNCVLVQQNATKAILYMPSGATYLFNVVENCYLSFGGVRTDTGCATFSSTTVNDSAAISGDNGKPIQGPGIPPGTTITAVSAGTGYTISNAATATASGLTFLVGGSTQSPWYIKSSSNALNVNEWRNVTCSANFNPVPFFYLENTGSSGYASVNKFDNIWVEQASGGVIDARTVEKLTIDNLGVYDATAGYVGSIINVIAGSGGLNSRNVTIRNSGRVGNAPFGTGCYDVNAPAVDGMVLVNVGPESGAPLYNLLSSATILGQSGQVPSTTLPAPIAVSGMTGATAASRFAGATASGHPVTGTFAAGDFVIDQSGTVWICTVAGTGAGATWAGGSIVIDSTASDIKAPGLSAAAGGKGQAADASHIHPLQDPLSLGQAQNFLANMAGASAALAVANQAYYSKLLAGGIAISNMVVDVTVSSGNVCVAAYTGTTAGASAAPTGGQLATSGGVACPALGVATISLGSTVTPKLNDWFGISCDNTTAAVFGNTGITNTLMGGMNYLQASAYPLPSTPAVSGGSTIRQQFIKGS